MRKILTTTLLCALLLGQTACGERSQAETDLRPWDSPQAGGAKADWQRDIKARMRNQSEYDSTR
jgi:outer membrane lipopolysaccharide assembly protein LptE/RlpB